MMKPGRFNPEEARASTDTSQAAVAAVTGPEDEMKKDFRKFLYAIFQFLGKKVPTEIQYDIARFLQHGPSRKIIAGFRGVGKSWITVCYVLWLLYCDPDVKLLIVSASSVRSVSFVNFALWLIREVPWLKHLLPKPNQRSSSRAFDVGPCAPDDSPSVRAVGVTGQKTGSRADEVINDDVEIPENSATTTMREKLKEGLKEAAAILKPNGKITYLGTYQNEESVYAYLETLGYTVRVWPSQYPKDVTLYGARLAPIIRNRVAADPSLVGKSTEPSRFSDEDLAQRAIEWGRAGYALQFMLDPSLSDETKYVLRLADLIVMSIDPKRGPDTLVWTNDAPHMHKDLPVLGFNKDHYYGPATPPKTFSEFQSIVGYIDPSGRGQDETVLAIGSQLHGRTFLLKLDAWRDGYAPETLKEIAALCVEWNVRMVRIESNFGQGMYASLLQPHLDEAWKAWNQGKPPGSHGRTGVEEERAGVTQKEKRISQSLGPPTQSHRLIVNTSVIVEDWESVQKLVDVEAEKRHTYSFAHQFSHLTEEPGCLTHDDRLDAVAGLVRFWEATLGINPAKSADALAHERAVAEIEEILEGAIKVGGLTDDDDKKRREHRHGRTTRGSRKPKKGRAK